MFDIAKHRQVMITVLKAIYSDPEVHGCLGFKGGTAAYLFYNLPRFSVDLDFDLLDESKKDLVLKKIDCLAKKYPSIKINIYKNINSKYQLRTCLGIGMLVQNKEDMLAGKLAVFLARKVFAARDAFDLWFFLKNNWQVDAADLEDQIGLTPKVAFQKALEKTEKISQKQMLQGLAELIEEKQKIFVREKLLTDLSFYLRLYLDSINHSN